jgi:hypothetical protein
MIITDIHEKVNKTPYQVIVFGENICRERCRGFEKPQSKYPCPIPGQGHWY